MDNSLLSSEPHTATERLRAIGDRRGRDRLLQPSSEKTLMLRKVLLPRQKV